MNNWFVYIVRCADKSLYTGIAKDVERRVEEHNGLSKEGLPKGGLLKGAKYTRPRRPVRLVYEEALKSRSEACIREAAIKRLSKLEKENLLHSV